MTDQNRGQDSAPQGSALEQFLAEVTPIDWSYIPVDSNKATYIAGWNNGGLSRREVERRYEENYHLRQGQIEKFPGATEYCGIGVLTGPPSMGLIAIDIDGPIADARFKEQVGLEYEPHGEESTMSWWSGTPGRRQILYMVPKGMVPSLYQLRTLILKEDGTWEEGQGDVGRKQKDRTEKYEEVVVRFRDCMSVMPGSKHPSGRTYEWLNYHDGMPALAPDWLRELIRPYRKADTGWNLILENLADKDRLEVAGNADPAHKWQKVGDWFKQPKIQEQLAARMKELVFNDPAFDDYGWKDRNGGNKPQYTSGCPIHGGESGTSFQINQLNGLWDCKGCHASGNMLSFACKTYMGDWEIEPGECRSKWYEIVEPIAEALGYDLADELRLQAKQAQEDGEKAKLRPHEWFEAIKKIIDEEKNPAVKFHKLAGLAQEQGFRYSGTEVEAQYVDYAYSAATEKLNNDPAWYTHLKGMQYVIPHLLRTPSQTILHSAGGVGKSATAIALARAIGRGEPMRIKGMEVPIPKGKVLYINSDQTEEKLYQDLVDNGFEHEDFKTWFVFKRNWQMTQTMVLRDWIRDIEPALVIIDSIGSCSSQSTVTEIEKAYANPLYLINQLNGSPSSEGFPSTCFLYIHHNNASGEARGTKYLINAVDEQWALRRPENAQERTRITQSGFNPWNTRILEFKKSRQGREGDCFLVERDVDHRYALHDWTPTVSTPPSEGEGEQVIQADPEPVDVVLDIVKQKTQEQREEGVKKLGVTADVAYEELCEQMLGWTSASKHPAKRTVHRWLKRWAEKKLLKEEKRRTPKGDILYFISRALPCTKPDFSSLTSNPSDTNQSEVMTNFGDSDLSSPPNPELVDLDLQPGGDDNFENEESVITPTSQSTTETHGDVVSSDFGSQISREADESTEDDSEPDLSGF